MYGLEESDDSKANVDNIAEREVVSEEEENNEYLAELISSDYQSGNDMDMKQDNAQHPQQSQPHVSPRVDNRFSDCMFWKFRESDNYFK